jgi:hypothetical protein
MGWFSGNRTGTSRVIYATTSSKNAFQWSVLGNSPDKIQCPSDIGDQREQFALEWMHGHQMQRGLSGMFNSPAPSVQP